VADKFIILSVRRFHTGRSTVKVTERFTTDVKAPMISDAGEQR
jgi:hypothetical protein